MQNRSRKPRKPKLPDPNTVAFGIIQAIAEEPAPPAATADGKDPAAVALGRKGGLVGGKARAAMMTAQERSDAAKKAAAARWGKQT